MQLLKHALPILCLIVFSVSSRSQTIEEYEQISDSFYYAGKYDTALMYAAKAEVIIKKDSGFNSISYANLQGQFLAMNYEKMQDMKNAEYFYKKSIRLFQFLHDTASIGYAETLANYGNFCTQMGSYTEALTYLITGESLLKDHALQVDSYGGALNNLANAYTHLGLYSKAEGYYIDLLNLIKEKYHTDENYYGAKVYSNLANVYNKTGVWKRAKENLVKAISIFKKIKVPKDEYYVIFLKLARLYVERKDTAASLSIFFEIIDSVSSYKNVALYVSALNGIGEVKQQQHKWDEAQTYYLSALQKLEQDEKKSHIYFAIACNLASLFSAKKEFKKVDSLLRGLLFHYVQSKDRDQYYYIEVFSAFCANLIRINKLSEASDSVQSLTKQLFHTIYRNLEGMPQSEKVQFAETLKSNFDLVYSILVLSATRSKEMLTLGLFELLQLKGMILSDQSYLFNKLRSSRDTVLNRSYSDWLQTQQILYFEYSRLYKNRLLYTDSLELLAESYERKFHIERRLAAEEDNNIIIDKIRKSLSSREAAIEFVRFNYISVLEDEAMYGAFILKPGQKEPQFILLCKEHQLKLLFTNQKGKWIGQIPQFKNTNLNTAAKLYNLIWAPLEPYLRNISSIYYSPAGIINSISFNAISTGCNSLLIDRYNLYLVSSTRVLIDKAIIKSKPVHATIWGKMNYSKEVYLNAVAKEQKLTDASIDKNLLSDNFSKGGLGEEWNSITIEETDKLKNIFSKKKIPTKIYKGGNATEENFKSLASSLSGIIHISTHGFFINADIENKNDVLFSNMYTTHINPLLRCGLIFSGANYVWSGNEAIVGKEDGILTGYEISQMDLRKADLVVLSACETALGDLDTGNEGVIGLQRSFKLAGAGKLMVSLWKVPPKQTQELMISFYKKFLDGESAANALLHSQRDLRKKYPPYYWAAFVIIE